MWEEKKNFVRGKTLQSCLLYEETACLCAFCRCYYYYLHQLDTYMKRVKEQSNMPEAWTYNCIWALLCFWQHNVSMRRHYQCLLLFFLVGRGILRGISKKNVWNEWDFVKNIMFSKKWLCNLEGIFENHVKMTDNPSKSPETLNTQCHIVVLKILCADYDCHSLLNEIHIMGIMWFGIFDDNIDVMTVQM